MLGVGGKDHDCRSCCHFPLFDLFDITTDPCTVGRNVNLHPIQPVIAFQLYRTIRDILPLNSNGGNIMIARWKLGYKAIDSLWTVRYLEGEILINPNSGTTRMSLV